METSWILVDSNAYFRLAKLKHPLLKQNFGKKNYCLAVISELDKEYARSQKLRTKFSWVKDPEYVQNRKDCMALPAETLNRIWITNSIVKGTAVSLRFGTSAVDMMCIAYGVELGIPVVTDDKEMTVLGNEFDLEMLSSLEVMHLMAIEGFVSMELAISIVKDWVKSSDTPSQYRNHCQRLFGNIFLDELDS